jgi:hypothetical protein
MIGIIYTYSNKRKIIVMDYKIRVGSYILDGYNYSGMLLYSLEEYSDLKTIKLKSDRIIEHTRLCDTEDMIIDGLIKIYLSKK